MGKVDKCWCSFNKQKKTHDCIDSEPKLSAVPHMGQQRPLTQPRFDCI